MPSPLTVRELCAKLKMEAPAARAERVISGMATLDRAAAEHVSFVQKEKHVEGARASNAGLILAPVGLAVDHPGVIHLKDVMDGVLTVLEYFYPEPPVVAGVHATAVVAASASIAAGVEIGAGVVIEEGVLIDEGTCIGAGSFIGANSSIGGNCRIGPRVTILHGTRVGQRVRVHAGTVIGSDGFRYELTRGRLCKVPQVGIVVIEDDVEIGANCAIDRAFLNETVIGARTKIDNLVHIAHNVVIGSDSILVAQVGIAGSSRIGRGVTIAGQAGIKDHVTIGDGARIGGQSGVQSDIGAQEDVMGTPAIPFKDYARFVGFYRRFAQHRKRQQDAPREGEES